MSRSASMGASSNSSTSPYSALRNETLQTFLLMNACRHDRSLNYIKNLIQNGANVQERDIDGLTLLHIAARYSSQKLVEFLLKLNRISVNATDYNNRTPIMLACYDGGRLNNVKILEKNGANVLARDNVGLTLLHIAARYSKQNVVEFLVNLKKIPVNEIDKNSRTPLMHACAEESHLDNIKMLLKYGADIKALDNFGSTLLHFASYNSKREVLEFFLNSNEILVNITNKTSLTPLMHACGNEGRLDNIEILLKNGADIKARGNNGATVLHYAAFNSKIEVLKFLLEQNEIPINVTDKNNRTPLMHACCEGGCLDNIKMLIENGADFHERDKHGTTLLHFASAYSKQEVVEFVLRLNTVHVNETNNENLTPLMSACGGGNLANTQTLIKNGADINVRTNDGSTLLHYASRSSKGDVLEFLLKRNEISVNLATNDNVTPLMCACFEGGHLGNIQTLIKNDADIHVKTKDGCNVFHFACAFSNLDVIKFFFHICMKRKKKKKIFQMNLLRREMMITVKLIKTFQQR